MNSVASMLRASPFGTSLAAFGVSTLLHAAVLLAPMGHSAPYRDDVDLEWSIDALEPALPTPEPAVPPPLSPAPHGPTHTHPYPVPLDHDAIPHDPTLEHRVVPVAALAPALAAPARTTDDGAPRFTMAIGQAATAYGAVSPGGAALPHDADDPGAAVPEESVDGKARLVRGLSPEYPDAARARGVEGDVRVELVVSPSGAVESARVVRGAGGGLDEAALRAVRRYQFAPATQGGRPVRVRMSWSVQFRLR
jgi:protein TonB